MITSRTTAASKPVAIKQTKENYCSSIIVIISLPAAVLIIGKIANSTLFSSLFLLSFPFSFLVL